MTATANRGFWASLARPDGWGDARLTLAASLLLVAVIAVADHVTGYDIRLAILYLIPIAWTTWRLGGKPGAGVAAVSAVCWVVTFGATHPNPDSSHFVLEGTATGVTFLTIVL